MRLIYGTRLKNLIYKKGFSLTMVNDELNRLNNTNKSLQNLSHRISNETLKYTEVIQILDILNYKCKWVPNTFDEDEAKMHIKELYKILNSEIAEDFSIDVEDVFR